jgi:hypothetical protein
MSRKMVDLAAIIAASMCMFALTAEAFADTITLTDNFSVGMAGSGGFASLPSSTENLEIGTLQR